MRTHLRTSICLCAAILASVAAIQFDRGLFASPGDLNVDKGTEIQPRLIEVTATVDGSGRIVFKGQKVRYEHNHWDPPSNVRLDDIIWTELDQTPPTWSQVVDGLDMSGARIVKRTGRDVVALETTKDGFDLYFSDSPNDAADYQVTIAIPRRK